MYKGSGSEDPVATSVMESCARPPGISPVSKSARKVQVFRANRWMGLFTVLPSFGANEESNLSLINAVSRVKYGIALVPAI
jgi:hypothetical protein